LNTVNFYRLITYPTILNFCKMQHKLYIWYKHWVISFKLSCLSCFKFNIYLYKAVVWWTLTPLKPAFGMLWTWDFGRRWWFDVLRFWWRWWSRFASSFPALRFWLIGDGGAATLLSSDLAGFVFFVFLL
jgi:hypothetical protein